MMLIDANLLLYAHDAGTQFRGRAKHWLEASMNRGDRIGLPWIAILAFLRIGTNVGLLRNPLSIAEAISAISEWLAYTTVSIVHPTDRHWSILSRLMTDSQVRGRLVTDAHLAALAIEHGATLCTTDRDFKRFEGLRVLNPLD